MSLVLKKRIDWLIDDTKIFSVLLPAHHRTRCFNVHLLSHWHTFVMRHSSHSEVNLTQCVVFAKREMTVAWAMLQKLSNTSPLVICFNIRAGKPILEPTIDSEELGSYLCGLARGHFDWRPRCGLLDCEDLLSKCYIDGQRHWLVRGVGGRRSHRNHSHLAGTNKEGTAQSVQILSW